ncbi:thiosulfate oxidation carrier complex protein SoxZ [Telmatospirillum sp. J64-1]|uniref:thiosulfate oxidation carrier complex protein SoxZ n=1 Tax=Telmatospirillum sp. J64-1 TaxID=2502183 RepID=UPI00115E8CAF|nr:thiosulfate oxidation carrier complex protein SoxZ [Telmatospirillum sp. J64-1]
MSNDTIKTRVPATARKGEVIEIKTTIGHDMETGQRQNASGQTIPRRIINKFVCTYNGKEVFVTDWYPGIAANPYMAFFLRAEESGTIEMAWHDDDGSVYTTSSEITVS